MAKAVEVTAQSAGGPTLARQMGLLGLVATGACSMIGAGVNVIPIMIQRNVPGIGPNVLVAYFIAMIPAVLAALAYAVLASGMPRAGGSYVYASRAVHPYLGFVASFSQWFGLAMAMGVVAYVLVPFLRDIAISVGLGQVAAALDWGPIRVTLALVFLWTATAINLVGIKTYEKAMVVFMILMFVGGAVAIPAGFYFDHADFAAALAAKEGATLTQTSEAAPLDLYLLFAATAILFSSFIGFDSIAQAGGEAREPERTLPLSIGISVALVGTFYMLFTGAVYHAVPWQFIAERGAATDLTAPGLLGYLLPPVLTIIIVGGSAVSLYNSLPGMILGISRLMFAWGEDGIFPRAVARVHRHWRTPHVAILVAAFAATGSIFGCHLAGDFFLGVDLLVIGMLVNFIVMCLSVLTLPRRNPDLAAGVRFMRSRPAQWVTGVLGVVSLGVLLVAQIAKDLRADVAGWYFRSTYSFLVVLAVATVIFLVQWRKLRRAGVDLEGLYSTLPPE